MDISALISKPVLPLSPVQASTGNPEGVPVYAVVVDGVVINRVLGVPGDWEKYPEVNDRGAVKRQRLVGAQVYELVADSSLQIGATRQIDGTDRNGDGGS